MKNIIYSGTGFFDLLLIVNIILKLTHVINWSWWIVLWPLWFGIILLILFIIFVLYCK